MFKKLLKNKNTLFMILAVSVGILLIVFGSLNGTDASTSGGENTSLYPGDELKSYTELLEKRVKEHIDRIDGVSNVSVMLTIDSSNEKIYASNGQGKDYVIIKDSSGNEKPIMLQEINASIRGIAVVCDFGGSDLKRQQIIEMLSALFNIGTNKISVMMA